jgi:hypothetical protein
MMLLFLKMTNSGLIPHSNNSEVRLFTPTTPGNCLVKAFLFKTTSLSSSKEMQSFGSNYGMYEKQGLCSSGEKMDNELLVPKKY